MKIFTNTEFKGHYPVGTAAVVVANDADSAAKYLSTFLAKSGLPDAKAEDMQELPFTDGRVAVLNDGDY